jgi:bifunctional non-homologous end joining protein LigD
MPVTWDELQKALEDKDTDGLYFEPEEALLRLKEVGDLFAPVLSLKQRIPGGALARAPL